MPISIDQAFLLETLSELVRTDSINPSLTPTGAGETQIASLLAERMRSLGLNVRLYEPQPGRVSVLGRLKGRGGGRSLMLNGHSDTVGVGDMLTPFEPVVKDGKLFGRGAQDMKAGLAASLAAVKALVDGGIEPGGDLLLAAVADEEYASLGTSGLIEVLRTENALPDAAIICEPTGLQIAAAHRGFVWIEVQVGGKAAHGSRWWEGVDANRMLGRLLVRLDWLSSELTQRTAHPLVGPPSLHTPFVKGGSEMSIYAAHSSLQIERRTVPGVTEAGVLAEVQAVIDRLATETPHFQAQAQVWLSRSPFQAARNSSLLPVLQSAAFLAMRKNPVVGGVAFWTDAALLSEAGVDTLIIGPHGGGLHSDEEWVDLDSCQKLASILAQTAIEYCKT
jgi:acetylornithine deacetylase